MNAQAVAKRNRKAAQQKAAQEAGDAKRALAKHEGQDDSETGADDRGRGISPLLTTKPQENSNIVLVTMLSEEHDKERYNKLTGELSLSPADQKTCRDISAQFLDVYSGKGTIGEDGKPIPAMTVIQAMQQASQNKLRAVVWGLALHAGRKSKEHPENTLIWFDLLTQYTENQERRHDREAREASDMQSVRDLFGGYWVVTKSEIRRTMKRGYQPKDFNSANAYIQASKPPKKARAPQTGTSTTTFSPAGDRSLDTIVGSQHPSVAAALVTAAKMGETVRELDKVDYGEMLGSITALTRSLPADPKSPQHGLYAAVKILLSTIASIKGGDIFYTEMTDILVDAASRIEALHKTKAVTAEPGAPEAATGSF